MNYLYENLGEDHFQEICQSLLVKEFPNVQCFPIRQPDGGRDAVAYFAGEFEMKATTPFYVFQVKYVRKPLAEEDPHSWLVKTIEAEAPKIARLVPKGARAYYLLTNIPGTSHLDVGSIDTVNALLRSALHDIVTDVHCWWRDDLNRRMDNAYDLKWAYPQVMSGPDLLRLIIEEGLSEDRERRSSAIRTFVRKQYNDDEEVRFKEVELQSKLLDLFVDVPITGRNYNPAMSGTEKMDYITARRISHFTGTAGTQSSVGACAALLNKSVQKYLPQIVLEGAPGQGKSTLSQYLCQVHRMRILQEACYSELPKEHKPESLKIPFKVILRDFSTWLNKRDPFTPETNDAIPENWNGSLESFLAAQINHFSGGVGFSVADLHAVAKLASMLLVLDGLDEVADINQREETIKQIIAGVSRLREVAASLQVVITSRPTAFTTAVVFPDKQYPHLQLDDLSNSLITEYAAKWIKSRRLSLRQASDINRILKQKIELPHIKDLARNPMQLSILLSLVHTQGSSLPDKRTALYDNYVRLFFNRESEKEDIVRDNRELLIDIHQYLGWYLHSEAEKGANAGSINIEMLNRVLRDYLASEGRDISLVANLFTAVRDRVMFLVSRVQGTYEFEVQPLREYFAARHLFETAPYAYAGAPIQARFQIGLTGLLLAYTGSMSQDSLQGALIEVCFQCSSNEFRL